MMKQIFLAAAAASGASAACVDQSYCVEAAAAFDTLIAIGWGCESTVKSIAEQVGPEAEAQFAGLGLPDDGTVADFW
jgi:hypothetical protein